MRWVFYPIAALLALAILGMATLAAVSLYAWPNLPSLDTLTDYRPRIPLRVYTSDGYLLGEFGEERRDVVRIADVPPVLKQAILAADQAGAVPGTAPGAASAGAAPGAGRRPVSARRCFLGQHVRRTHEGAW